MRQGHTKGAAGAAEECAEKQRVQKGEGGLLGCPEGGGRGLLPPGRRRASLCHRWHRRQGPLPALRLGARPGARAGGVRGGWQQGPGVGQMHAAATKRLAVNKTRPSVAGVVF